MIFNSHGFNLYLPILSHVWHEELFFRLNKSSGIVKKSNVIMVANANYNTRLPIQFEIQWSPSLRSPCLPHRPPHHHSSEATFSCRKYDITITQSPSGEATPLMRTLLLSKWDNNNINNNINNNNKFITYKLQMRWPYKTVHHLYSERKPKNSLIINKFFFFRFHMLKKCRLFPRAVH